MKLHRLNAMDDFQMRRHRLTPATAEDQRERQRTLGLFRADFIRNLARQPNRYIALLQDWAERNGPKAETPRQVFREAYLTLLLTYPVEYVLKTELIRHLDLWQRGAYMATEFQMRGGHVIGQARADVICLPESGQIAYEIKTSYDSIFRLKGQIENYSKAFDRVVLVGHADSVYRFSKHVPEWVGVYEVDRAGCHVIREPKRHPDNLSKRTILDCMYKPERVAFVQKYRPKARYVGSRYIMLSKDIVKSMSVEEVSQEFCRLVASNQSRRRYIKFLRYLPSCFTAALYDYYLLQRDLRSLIEIMNEPFI